MTIQSGYRSTSPSSPSPQSWSELSSSSTYSLPLSSTYYHGNFSAMVIGIVPCGFSFSIFRETSAYTPHKCTYAHTPPPCRQAIYREVTTPVNDGNAELEPISTADVTNPPHTHTRTQWSVSIYVSSDAVLQMHRDCAFVCVCVCFVWTLFRSISFGEVKSWFS